MIQFAICDDEPYMLQELSQRLSGYMQAKGKTAYKTTPFASGQQLLQSGGMFDLIFLDIHMQEPDGLTTARILRQQGKHALLVFVTILKESVFDAFEVEAFDYLIKPLDDNRFLRVMDRALQTLERRTANSLIIQSKTACELIPLDRIAYCEVQGRKLYIHQDSGKVTAYYDKLKNLEQQVDARFFKCHRSYLVNLDYVRGCQAGRVLLEQGQEIPVSRLRERELIQALLIHMKKRGL